MYKSIDRWKYYIIFRIILDLYWHDVLYLIIPTTKENNMTILEQTKVIKRILNDKYFFTCACGFKCMPMVTVKNIFICPECDKGSFVD